MRILELEAELARRGIPFTRTWEREDPDAHWSVNNYTNIFRINGEVVATGCMGDITVGVERWIKARAVPM